ncbi:hypothetical protein LMA00_07655 [Burkholderia ambifaria]|uniref:hypothetical protein n=1 Tax=Burkholderia ambifaria TaxID=152480 RepID=UPI001E31B87A|nr:hypothetical protein [Burkholderia ambifaria]UEP49613.1 hypothetical protein LMA00_07655 [Burkholderia ambifaria]
MNKTLTDQQIEAAKEAGFYWHPIRKRLVVRHSSGAWVAVDELLAHFATLLAAQQPEPIAHLTDDHRGKIERAEEQLRGRGPKDVEAANGLLDVLTAHAVQPVPRAEVIDAMRTYPDEITPELRDVLGRPNFWCGPIAHEMRAAGADIKTKAEDEQAHVLHWLVKLVLDHGDAWQEVAVVELRAIREKANAASAGEGQ